VKKGAFRYRILVEWSAEDRAIIARVPALPGCIAHGPTAEKAAHEAEVAAGLMLDVMKEDGKAPPPVDAAGMVRKGRRKAVARWDGYPMATPEVDAAASGRRY
jgi:predicted RNase H-like HicB family nuclease